jgi:hypothetical protein
VGDGRSLEAAFELEADVPAGTWTLVADGIITASVDVNFRIIWRKASGDDDVIIAEWDQHFDPRGGGDFTAQAYEVTAEGERIDYSQGDELIFRYEGTGTDIPMAYIPNGEGDRMGGRIPYILLPQ